MELSRFPKVTIILRGYNYNQVRTVMEALEGQEVHYALGDNIKILLMCLKQSEKQQRNTATDFSLEQGQC